MFQKTIGDVKFSRKFSSTMVWSTVLTCQWNMKIFEQKWEEYETIEHFQNSITPCHPEL